MAVTAGLGSGKTHGAVQWLFDRLALNAKAQFFGYMMPIYELIHNTAIPVTRKVLTSLGRQEFRDFEFVRSPFPKCLIKPTGQEIHYISGNRPEKIRSVEYGGLVIDEPGVTPRESIERVKERLRDDRAEVLQILMPGTPEGINHYAEEFDSDTLPGWDRSKPRDHTLCRKGDDGKEVWFRRFRLTTYDNAQHLPEGYISQRLDDYRSNPAYVEAYLLGRFVALVTGNCYQYKPQLHDVPDEDPTPYIDLYLSLDFNANPMAWVSLQKRQWYEYGVRGERMLALHCAETGATQLEEAMIEFAAKHPVRLFKQTPIWVYGDMSGHAASHKVAHSDYETIKHYLRAIGYERVEICALRYNPLETMTVDAVNRWLQNNYLFLCRRCSALRKSLMSTRWKEGTKKIDKPAGETHTHHGDALKYVAYALQEDIIRKAFSFNI